MRRQQRLERLALTGPASAVTDEEAGTIPAAAEGDDDAGMKTRSEGF